MKLPIRNIKNVYLRRAALILGVTVTWAAAFVLFLLVLVSRAAKSFCETASFEFYWLRSEAKTVWREVVKIWSKDFTND